MNKNQIWTCSLYIIYQERMIITEVKGARTEIAVQIYRPRLSRVFPALPLVRGTQSWSAIGRLLTQLSGCGNYKCFDSSHRVNVNVQCIHLYPLQANYALSPGPCISKNYIIQMRFITIDFILFSDNCLWQLNYLEARIS